MRRGASVFPGLSPVKLADGADEPRASDIGPLSANKEWASQLLLPLTGSNQLNVWGDIEALYES